MGLAIAAIVLPWVGASYTELIEATERKDAAQLLASGLRSARSEAIMRNRTVVVRGIDNDWGRGWRITLDDNEKTDRKSVVEGKSVSVSVDLGGRRIIKKNKNNNKSGRRAVYLITKTIHKI